MSTVQANDTVKVHYTGKLTNGQIFDSSVDRDPLQVELGKGQLIPGFEQGLVNMKVNEQKTITIDQKDAYGPVSEQLFQKVNKSDLPKEITPEVGMNLVGTNPDGSQQQFRIAKVEDEFIVIDANHPLAGQDLIFDLQVVEIL